MMRLQSLGAGPLACAVRAVGFAACVASPFVASAGNEGLPRHAARHR